MDIKITKLRIINIFAVLIYVNVFLWSYIEWLAPKWGYMGVEYDGLEYIFKLQCIFFCILPAFWIPLYIERPTMTIYWILYLMSYIPMIVGVSLSPRFTQEQIFLLQFSLMSSLRLTGLGYNLTTLNIKTYPMSNKIFWRLFYFLTFCLFIYVLYVYKGNMKLVSPFSKDLYDLRFAGSDLAEGTGVGYPVLWLSGACFPFIFGIGVIQKNRIYIIIGILGQIILYTTAANKAFILSIVFMIFFYFLRKITKQVGLVFTITITILIITLISIQTYAEGDIQLFFFAITSLFMLRTLAISSMNIVQYYDFFLHNPYTHYSHINIVGKFIKYPYGNLSVGQTIGDIVTGNSDTNFNANFYITDGLASFGLVGVVIIGLISGIIFYLIDSLSQKHDILLTTMLLTYASINLMNFSIFTALLSGGLLLIMLFLFFLNPTSKLYN